MIKIVPQITIRKVEVDGKETPFEVIGNKIIVDCEVPQYIKDGDFKYRVTVIDPLNKEGEGK